MADEMTLGQRIRLLRKAKGWSQQHLADACYVSQVAVSLWENDDRSPARRSRALLATALGTSRQFLFGDEETAA